VKSFNVRKTQRSIGNARGTPDLKGMCGNEQTVRERNHGGLAGNWEWLTVIGEKKNVGNDLHDVL